MFRILPIATMICTQFAATLTHADVSNWKAALDAAGVSRGVVVHLGCGDGRATIELGRDSELTLRGMDRDAALIRVARDRVRTEKLAAGVSFATWSGGSLPFADNLVRVLIVEPGATRPDNPELLRVLAPGGRLIAGQGETWKTQVKPWPTELGEWPHWRHGADANAVTHDSVVAPPKSLQWIDRPLWLKHHNATINFSTMVSAGGRVFYIMDDALPGVFGLPEEWKLTARDAFNGLILWQRPLDKWGWSAWAPGRSSSRFDQPIDISRRLVAHGGVLFTALGTDRPVARLNAATGKTEMTFAGTENVSEIGYHDGKLILSLHRPRTGVGDNAALGKVIAVYDAESGARLWQTDVLAGVPTKSNALRRYTSLFMAVGGECIFCVDGEDILCVNLRDGTERWRRPRPPRKDKPENYSKSFLINQCTLVAHEDLLLFNQIEWVGHTPWLEPTPSLLMAFSARDGSERWRVECGTWDYDAQNSFFVVDGLVWTHRKTGHRMIGINPLTGEVEREFSTEEAMTTQHHHRCYSNKATSRYLLTARRGVEFLDVRTGENRPHHWIRGACRYGIMPANGLLYVPPDPCMCYATAKVNGFLALCGRKTKPPAGDGEERLTKGPAYGKVGKHEAAPAATRWPTYRGDMARSGFGTGDVPRELAKVWRRELGGKLSAVSVSDDRVYVSSVTDRALHALDVGTGDTLWSFATAAPVDTPPTLYRGMALFGCADGCVYALRAEDGALCWRFRAAGTDRQIMAFGRLESATPCHGSVLLKDDRLYVTAGRSSFLDGGILLYAMDPLAGKVLQRRAIYTPDPVTGKMDYGARLRYDMPIDNPGALSDILVECDDGVYLRHLRFDPADLSRNFDKEVTPAERKTFEITKTQCGKVYRPGPQLASSSGLLDDSWFNQTFWAYANHSHSRLLVFNETHTFGVRAYGGNASRHTRSKYTIGKGRYTLFADDRANAFKRAWAVPVPIRASSMVGVGDRLYVAGAPAAASGDVGRAAFTGKTAGILWTVGTATGNKLTAHDLPAAPVWNGMAAAGGRLFLALKDGSVSCLGGE